MGKLQKYFLTGLLTLLPIWLVWIVFKFVFGLWSGISEPGIGPACLGQGKLRLARQQGPESRMDRKLCQQMLRDLDAGQ